MADRSPNYPSIGLTEAMELLRTIWGKGKRAPMSREMIAQSFGKSLSGPTATKISALGKYGLLERADGGMRVSDLGMQVLHGQPEESAAALKEAALSVDLVADLLDHYADADAEVLASHLMLKRDFSEDGAAKFADVFRDVVEVAKLYGSHTIEPESEIATGGNSTPTPFYQMSTSHSTTQKQPTSQPQRPISVLIGFDEKGEAIYGHVAFDVPIKRGYLKRLGSQLGAMEDAIDKN